MKRINSTPMFVGLVIVTLLVSCKELLKKKNEQGQMERGSWLMDEGEYREAAHVYRQALMVADLTKEDRSIILGNLANAYSMLDEEDSSRYFAYEGAMLFDSNSTEYMILMADVHLTDDNVPEALRLLKKAEKSKLEDTQLYNLLGLIYMGEFGLEYEDLDKALQYNTQLYVMSQDRISRELLADTYWYREEYNEAEKHYAALFQEHPDMLDYLYNIGCIKWETDHIAEANIVFDKVLKQDSSYAEWVDMYREEESTEE